MEETISQLCELLQHPNEKILVQATEILKGNTADIEQCRHMQPCLPHLLKLTSSSNQEIAENALISLVNITSSVPTTITQLIKLNACTRLMDAVIGPNASLVHQRLMLLTNLTTENEGAIQLLDLKDKDITGQRLLRLAVLYTNPPLSYEIPKAKPLHGLNIMATSPNDEYEYAAMVLMNTTLLAEGRAIFFETPDFFMPKLLDSVSGDNPIRKQGIIGVIRNLCFEQSKHQFLLERANLLPYIVKPLFSKTISSNMTAEEMLKKAFPNVPIGDPEPLPINRRNLLETLMLLTQSEFGLKYLRSHHIVFLLRELDDYETSPENKELGLRLAAILIGPQNTDQDDAEQPQAETNDVD